MKTIAWFVGAAAAAAVTTATLAIPYGPAMNKKSAGGSYIGAQQCLELPSSEAIIRCTQRYM